MYYLAYIMRFLQKLQNSSPVPIMVDLYYFHISVSVFVHEFTDFKHAE